MKLNLPAGLIDHNLEIFKDGKHPKALHDGEKGEYIALPTSLREPFQAELIADNKAIEAMKQHWHLVSGDEMEEKFVSCRYGSLNDTPDLKNGKTTPDFPVCDEIKTCECFGFVCKAPKGPVGTLTRQEYLVAVLVAKGKLDKEIAFELEISINTVKTYHARIHEKLCLNNRIEIALWLHKNGIM